MSLVSPLIPYCDLLRLKLLEKRPQVDKHYRLLKRSRHLGVRYFILLGQDIVMLCLVLSYLRLQQLLV